MNFDAEALAYADGKLLILSKDRSKPYTRAQCKIYEARHLSIKPARGPNCFKRFN